MPVGEDQRGIGKGKGGLHILGMPPDQLWMSILNQGVVFVLVDAHVYRCRRRGHIGRKEDDHGRKERGYIFAVEDKRPAGRSRAVGMLRSAVSTRRRVCACCRRRRSASPWLPLSRSRDLLHFSKMPIGRVSVRRFKDDFL